MKQSNLVLSSLMGFAFTSLIALSVPSTAHASAGGGSTGGGDAAEVEFSNMGRAIVNDLACKKIPVAYDLNDLSSAVSGTQVTMVRHPINLDGKPRDAINLPPLKQIEVDRGNWISLGTVEKIELAYHEYLGIAGIESNKYPTSQSLLSFLGAEELKRLGAASMPDPLYSCKISHYLDNPSNNDVCGTMDFHNTIGGWDEIAGCGGVSISIVRMPDGLSYGLSTPNGSQTSIQLDPYSAPTTFELKIDIPSKKHRGSFDYYYMDCTKKSDS
jgi:hypothetical protein